VPVCLSSSHIAYGSIRMEPVFMVLGQSAATAAALAIDSEIPVQKVPYEKLAAKLIADKQVLQWIGPRPAARYSLDPAKLPGLVFDDEAMTRSGEWLRSSASPGFVGSHYWHDSHEGVGEKSVRFKIEVISPGRYEVRISYTANPNRATNVSVTTRHADGMSSHRINQRQQPPIFNSFLSLGKFPFEPGKPAWVEIKNDSANGHVIADAVQLLLEGD
jgi:hypothetical protein